jgi:hypothetical protein
LIVDRHESYQSYEFEKYYKDWNIIPLYILVHSSHKLQPLDVRCFGLLKRIYRTKIEKLIHAYITHVSKEDFFSAFVIAFRITITESNIRSGFRATGLVLYDLDYMISQLDIRLRTSTLALTLPTI